MNHATLVLLLVSLTVVTNSIMAASIGDVAPPLTIGQWVKGSPVRIAPGTNIYVVEFWATWCPPCRKSIPIMTELQKRYADRGVIFIGISDELPTTVAPFVAAQGAGMDYRVVVDSTKRSTKNWQTAFGIGSVPHAYIVGTNGTVLWHDNPLSQLAPTLEKVVNGTFDIERAKSFETGGRYLTQYTEMVYKHKSAEKAKVIGEKILSDYAKDWRVPNRLARAILTDPQVQSRDLDLAFRAATKSVEMTHRRTSDALEMLARAQFATGSKVEALATAKEALSVSVNAEDKDAVQKMVALYEKSGVSAGPKK